MKLKHTIWILSATLSVFNLFSAIADDERPNVLFIVVDDLRPELGCYGEDQILSPNIDKLAKEGTIFNQAYCQVPVCGASRASLLTGLRPKRDRFINYAARADVDAEGYPDLPSVFKQNGYTTVSLGKVYHHGQDSKDSWSLRDSASLKAARKKVYQLPENLELLNQVTTELGKRGAATECADVPESEYFGYQLVDEAVKFLESEQAKEKPWFLAVGFTKPHLPFSAPKKYWDMYDREKIAMASNPYPPKDAPGNSLTNFGELRNMYTGIPKKGPLNDELKKELKHGYYACVSYTDAMIGRLMEQIDALNLDDDTIIVLWGDHGWQLGEHSLWCKHTNYHVALHAPLMIKAPGTPSGQSSDALVEFVDIYPSLCDLAGIDLPEHLEGQSLKPLLTQPDQPWKESIYSRFFDGDSIRTDRYHYTEWSNDNGEVYSNMLYDHKTDPDENVNIASLPKYRQTVDFLSQRLQAHIREVETKL